MPVPVNDADAVPPTSAQTAAPRHQNGASSPPQIGSPKSDKSLSRSGSLLDMLHLKDVHIPKPPPVKVQTAAVALWTAMIPITLLLFISLFFFKYTRPLAIAYTIWFLFFDRAWVNKGGRRTEWTRHLVFWRYFAEYFPISTVKEADLPSDRKYIFGYHPHGIISMGAACTFATEATSFSKLFPGIKAHLLTIDANFWLPFYRDILMSTGIASVCRSSCQNILRMGNSIAIVIGGASESLYAYPGTNNLTLKKRYGFVKLALHEGADLVPTYGFGENDIFEQLPNGNDTLIYSFQKRFQSIFGFTFPFFFGRGVFTYNYGMMPYRRPVVVVVGTPIRVKQNNKPTKEEVEDLHRQYMEALQALWDKYKDEYAKHRKSELKFVA